MKTLHYSIIAILIIVTSFSSSNYHAYAPIPGKSTEQIYNESAIIVVGNIISESEIQNGTRTEYVIKPQEYLKPHNIENMTQPIHAQGIGSKSNHMLYFLTYQVGDRALFFLQKENDHYLISPYSIWTKSNCNGEQLLALNFSPGDFSVTQENNTYEKMFTGVPVNVTAYVHNNDPVLKSKYADVNFTVHTPRSDLILTEKRHVYIDECKGFASSSWIFVPQIPGRYNVSVLSYDENGTGLGGGSFCCISMVDRPQSNVTTMGLAEPPMPHDDGNSWSSIVVLGSIVGITTVAISVYVMRLNKK